MHYVQYDLFYTYASHTHMILLHVISVSYMHHHVLNLVLDDASLLLLELLYHGTGVQTVCLHFAQCCISLVVILLMWYRARMVPNSSSCLRRLAHQNCPAVPRLLMQLIPLLRQSLPPSMTSQKGERHKRLSPCAQQ